MARSTSPLLSADGARGLVGQAAEDDPLDGGRLAPVAVEGLDYQLHAGIEAHELVGPGADGRLAKALLANVSKYLCGTTHPALADERAVEAGKSGHGSLKTNFTRSGAALDLLDLVLQDLRRASPVALEGEFHVVRGDRIAVVELRVGAQRELGA